jgi:hypothetical protein
LHLDLGSLLLVPILANVTQQAPNFTHWIVQVAWTGMAARLILIEVDDEIAPCNHLNLVNFIVEDKGFTLTRATNMR